MQCSFFCSKKVSLPTREESIKYLLVGIFKHATVEAHSDCNSSGGYMYYTQSIICTVNCAHTTVLLTRETISTSDSFTMHMHMCGGFIAIICVGVHLEFGSHNC